MQFQHFIIRLTDHPLLLISVVLTLGVILVNGWTDAPNAIATCVATRCMSARAAILMAAVFNLLGVFLMTKLNAAVAQTITQMVDFGNDSHQAIIAISASMFAIITWATLAWAFGIPTSESHAMIAALTGSAIALRRGLSAVNGGEWSKILCGLVVSLLLGFGLGKLVCQVVILCFRGLDRRKTEPFFRHAQIFGAACTSFMHGAQDGQKFMGVLLLCTYWASGQAAPDPIVPPDWMLLLSSLVMGLGTAIGGKRIIKSVGMDMVKLEKYQGFSADIATSICLAISSLLGIPVSTTHAKTSAILGVGTGNRSSGVDASVVKEMALAWAITFPGCGLIGFVTTKLFILFF